MAHTLDMITPAQLAAGDADAWEVLRGAYAPLCRSLAARHGLDPSDVWQDGALRLWRALSAGRTFPTGEAFGAYLVRCVRSAALDAVRRRAARPEAHAESYHAAAEALGSESRLGDLAVEDVRPSDLADLLAGLPEPQRVALALRHAEMLRPREIVVLRPDVFADVGEVYAALHLGLGRLRRAMVERGAPEPVARPYAPAPEQVSARLRRGHCPACGVRAPGRTRVCDACRAAGRDVCPRCLTLTSRDAMVASGEMCRPCRQEVARAARGHATREDGRAAMVGGARKGHEAVTARRLQISREMLALAEAGASRAEIAARYGVSEGAVRQRLTKYRREIAHATAAD